MSVKELASYGIQEMSDEAIDSCLATARMGVIGLPDRPAPYLLPLSFGYEPYETVYFTYIIGENSRKQRLSEETNQASFLVYQVDSLYSWESVLLHGALQRVETTDWEQATDRLAQAWHPAIFEDADLSGGVELYSIDIMDWTGLRHTGLPPGFPAGPDDPGPGIE